MPKFLSGWTAAGPLANPVYKRHRWHSALSLKIADVLRRNAQRLRKLGLSPFHSKPHVLQAVRKSAGDKLHVPHSRRVNTARSIKNPPISHKPGNPAI